MSLFFWPPATRKPGIPANFDGLLAETSGKYSEKQRRPPGR
jgi:hypothetical protein